jgi:hypothetical protein
MLAMHAYIDVVVRAEASSRDQWISCSCTHLASEKKFITIDGFWFLVTPFVAI